MAVERFEYKGASHAARWLGTQESLDDIIELTGQQLEMPASGPLVIEVEGEPVGVTMGQWVTRSARLEIYVENNNTDTENIVENEFQYWYMPWTH